MNISVFCASSQPRNNKQHTMKKILLLCAALLALAVGIEALQTMHMRNNSWKNSGGNGVCDFLYPECYEGLFSYRSHKGKATYIPIICIGNHLLAYNTIDRGPKGFASYYIL